MYLAFYKLKAKPFQITCDPEFLWLGDKHQEALAMLHYGITDHRGFLLLTGEVGTGKTLLINHLVALLPEKTVVAKLSDPDLKTMEFYRMLADGFKMPQSFNNKAEFLIQFRQFLCDQASKSRQVLLIIDEAHRLDHRLLEVIRALSNIEFHDRKLIDIFLVGQPELNQLLMRRRNRALAQRFTLRHHIEPLDRNETAAYIHHRLTVAGGRKKLFKGSAVKKVFEYAGGIPRLINIICDHALLTGFINNAAKINADIITECAQELHIPTRQDAVPNIRAATDSLEEVPRTDPFHGKLPQSGATTNPRANTVSQSLDRYPKPPWMAKWIHAGIFIFIFIFWALVLINLKNSPKPNQIETVLMHSQQVPPIEALSPMGVAERDITLRIGATYATDEANSKANKAANRDKKIRRFVESPVPLNPDQGILRGQLSGNASKPLHPVAKEAEKLPMHVWPKTTEAQEGRAGRPAMDVPRKPLGVTKQAVHERMTLGWPRQESVVVRFGKTNEIASHSESALDQVAVDLVRFPERLVYLHGYAGEAESIADRQVIWRQMVYAVKSYLIGKGASSYQVKAVASDSHRAGPLTERQDGPYAVIEFPQDHHFTDYNPDK